MKKLIAFVTACFLSLSVAGCSGFDKEAASAPVTGYLDALSVGDLDKASEYESKEFSLNSITGAVQTYEEVLRSAGFGDTFNQEFAKFIQSWVQMCFTNYKIESVEPGKEKTEAQVTVSIQGLPLGQAGMEQMVAEAEADMQKDLQEYIKNDADLSDPEKLYGDVGKMVFDRMTEKLQAQDKVQSTVIFTTARQDDSDKWVITSALEQVK